MMRMTLNTELKREVHKMSDIGLSGAQFEINQEILRAFDDAVGKIQTHTVSNKKLISDALLKIMEPIAESMQFKTNTVTVIDEYSIMEFLKNKAVSREGSNWNQYINAFQSMIARMKTDDMNFGSEDIEILNDIGDALNEECNRHYRKLRG